MNTSIEDKRATCFYFFISQNKEFEIAVISFPSEGNKFLTKFARNKGERLLKRPTYTNIQCQHTLTVQLKQNQAILHRIAVCVSLKSIQSSLKQQSELVYYQNLQYGTFCFFSVLWESTLSGSSTNLSDIFFFSAISGLIGLRKRRQLWTKYMVIIDFYSSLQLNLVIFFSLRKKVVADW